MWTGIVLALLIAGLVITGVVLLQLKLGVGDGFEGHGSMPPSEASENADPTNAPDRGGQRPRLGAEPASRSTARRPELDSEAPAEATFSPIPLRDVMELVEKAHHVAILGGTGDGKTWTGEAIMRLLPHEEQLCVIDPNWEPGKWSGMPVITTDEQDSFAPVLQALYGIQREAKERKARTWNKQDRGPRLNIFWDEVNETMEELPLAGEYLRRWLRRVRYLNMKLWLFPQSDRVGALGLEGHGDARKNMLWIYIGGDARAKAEWLLSKSRTTEELAEWLFRQSRPCLIDWQGGYYAVDLSEVPSLVGRPIPSLDLRIWTPSGSATKQDLSDELDIGEENEVSAEADNLLSQKGGKAVNPDVQMKLAIIEAMDWSMIARSVRAGTCTEGEAIYGLFKVKPGDSPVYKAARSRLQASMAESKVSEGTTA